MEMGSRWRADVHNWRAGPMHGRVEPSMDPMGAAMIGPHPAREVRQPATWLRPRESVTCARREDE
eukprot:619282-Prymnesium_polylepis.1